jgi:uncharacterized membrane protein
MESLVNAIINLFSSLLSYKFGKEIIVFIISILPILELRGGLLAASLIGLNPVRAYIVSIIGNILPVPFILLFISKIIDWMEKSKIKFLNKFAHWLRKKAEKNKGQIEKYGYIGLVLFVGIPLPGTGAWTGCLIASLLNMDKKKSFISTFLGIIMASIIMMIISYGIIGKLL